MRNGFLGSVAALVTGAALALAQSPTYDPVTQRPIKLPDCGPATVTPPAPRPGPSNPAPTTTSPGFALAADPSALTGCCSPCPTTCSPRGPRGWLDVEYLIFFDKNLPVELPLITVGPPATGGALGAAGTGTVYGDRGVNFGLINGLRVTTGSWINQAQTVGLESSNLILERASRGMPVPQLAPPGNEVLARPFLDATTGLGSALPISAPGTLAGIAAAQASTRLYSSDNYLLFNLLRHDSVEASLLVGGRYLGLDESLEVRSLSSVQSAGATHFLGQPLPAGSGLAITDQADTNNHIYAGTLGLRTRMDLGEFLDLTVTGKVGLGVSHQVIFINGATTAFPATGGTLLAPGGVLASPTNVGRFTNDEFVVVPEVTASVGLYLTHWLKVFAGYNFLYISSVARPGQQFDPVVNPTLLPASATFGAAGGPVRPLRVSDKTDFYAHGVNLGVEIRY